MLFVGFNLGPHDVQVYLKQEQLDSLLCCRSPVASVLMRFCTLVGLPAFFVGLDVGPFCMEIYTTNAKSWTRSCVVGLPLPLFL